MHKKCGARMSRVNEEEWNEVAGNEKESVSVSIHSAYLGEVPILCQVIDDDQVSLIARTNGILVKTIDASRNSLRVKQRDYPLNYLDRLPATIISKKQCADNHTLIQRLKTQSTLTPDESSQLYDALIYNGAVDIQFASVLFLQFIQETFQMKNIMRAPVLFSIHNVADYENAFFSGKYMVYGNGKKRFYPMVTLDTAGHELGHAINSQWIQLLYAGHAGSLDEGYADIHGAMFEFYAYQKHPQLFGVGDWTQGEDNGNKIKVLRNMQDPFLSNPPQPKAYRQEYYVNPNSRNDSGGVHQNCSLVNYAFYLMAQKQPMEQVYQDFCKAYQRLTYRSSFQSWRDALTAQSPQYIDVLKDIGLDSTSVNDWIIGV